MSNTNIVPSLQVKGLFSFKEPWLANSGKVFTCVSVRSFQELLISNVDIFGLYYKTYGLSSEAYEKDLKDNCYIISLISEFNDLLNIPSSYIESFPNESIANYQRLIVSVDLGPFSDNFSEKHITDVIKDSCSTILGVDTNPLLHRFPLRDGLTFEEAKLLEQVRQGNIKNKEHYSVTIAKQNDVIEALKTQVEEYQRILVENKWYRER